MAKYISEICENVYDFFYDIKVNITSFWEKITGTLAYTKFIWQNDVYREWDYSYLYDLIQFKLERMGKAQKEDELVVDSSARADEIALALAYLHIYNTVEDTVQHNNVDAIREMYKQQQDAWKGFHDTLKEHAQKWWI